MIRPDSHSQKWIPSMHESQEDLLLHQLFERSVERDRDGLAVTGHDATLTYADLDATSNHFAGKLAEAGVRVGQAVLCALPRGAAALTAQLGVLKAGAVYVPADHDGGETRLRKLARQVVAAAVVGPAGLPAVLHVDLDARSSQRPPARRRPDDPAYIMFTSGSTGTPKGVVVAHRAIVSTTCARFDVYDEPVRRFLVVSPMTFDTALSGIWWTLAAGGLVDLAPDSPDGIMRAVDDALRGDRRISHTVLTPALYLNALQRLGTPAAGPAVTIVAGETCPPDLVSEHHRLQPRTRLYNEYGPTEGAVWCTGTELPAGSRVTVGRPIARTTVRIMDDQGHQVRDGVVGELWLGGSGLAAGYHDDPVLTADRFPDRPDGRFYRTGDRGRIAEDGTITLHGRVDDQIKLRGYRIEPAGIEAILRNHPGVAQAAVTVYEGRLVAYVVPVSGSPSSGRHDSDHQ